MDPVITPDDPEYSSDLTLTCRVSVPQKLHSQLVPYMTLTWSTPLQENASAGELVDDGLSLSLNLDISSVNETHNGVYTCHAVIQLPQSSAFISTETEYTLNVKGKCVLSMHSFCFYPFLLYTY